MPVDHCGFTDHGSGLLTNYHIQVLDGGVRDEPSPAR